MAAQHLIERGLRRFAYVGFPHHAFSLGREAGFRGELERAGYQAAVFHDRMSHVWRLGEW
jgi:DNA-binding LacI/PurR family transcriptional regulator